MTMTLPKQKAGYYQYALVDGTYYVFDPDGNSYGEYANRNSANYRKRQLNEEHENNKPHKRKRGDQKPGYFMYKLIDDKYHVVDPNGKSWGSFTDIESARKFKAQLNKARGKR